MKATLAVAVILVSQISFGSAKSSTLDSKPVAMNPEKTRVETPCPFANKQSPVGLFSKTNPGVSVAQAVAPQTRTGQDGAATRP